MTSFTPISRISAGIAVSLATGAAAASVATAAGEPKNQAPFTRVVTARGLTQELARSHASAPLVARGEAKNQVPFTRARTRGLHPYGFRPY
jgi:hypothetical protein